MRLSAFFVNLLPLPFRERKQMELLPRRPPFLTGAKNPDFLENAPGSRNHCVRDCQRSCSLVTPRFPLLTPVWKMKGKRGKVRGTGRAPQHRYGTRCPIPSRRRDACVALKRSLSERPRKHYVNAIVAPDRKLRFSIRHQESNRSVTAPRLADDTRRAYFARTPRV